MAIFRWVRKGRWAMRDAKIFLESSILAANVGAPARRPRATANACRLITVQYLADLTAA